MLCADAAHSVCVVAGDAFDRQRVMVKFDQGEMERQVCFVMGTGGLGQSVAFALARLGVAKIILLDMDNYEATNLNRQILGAGAQLLHCAA